MRWQSPTILAVVGIAILTASCSRRRTKERRASEDAAAAAPADLVDRLFPSPEWRTEEGTPRFVSAAEEEQLIARTLARVEADRERRCSRPVLRGEAQPGSAVADMEAVLAGEGRLAACFDYWNEHEDAIHAALRPPRRDADSEVLSHTRARGLDDPASTSLAVQTLAKRCRALDQAIARAVAHEDACSPFSVGAPSSVSPDRFLAAAWITAVRVRELARSGKPRLAIDGGLDAIRLGQDLARGDAAMIEFVIAQLGVTVLWAHLAAVLQGSERLSDADLGRIDQQLERLLASQIHPTAALSAEPFEYLLYEVLPALEPPGWEPPGGWSYLQRDRATAAQKRLIPRSGAEKQGALLSGLAHEKLARERIEACPMSSSLRTCSEGLAKLATRLEAASAELTRDPRSLLSTVGLASALARVPASAPRYTRDSLRDYAIRQYEKTFSEDDDTAYLRRAAFAEAALMSLRVLVNARLFERHHRRCVTQKDFDPGPLGALLERESFGDALSVEPAAGGALRIVAPAWVDYKHDPQQPLPLLELRCAASSQRER